MICFYVLPFACILHLDEFLNFQYTTKTQVDSAGRALCSVITRMIKNKGFPFKIFSMLYNACVVSIADYSAEVTGFSECEATNQLHLKAIRAFLGLPLPF